MRYLNDVKGLWFKPLGSDWRIPKIQLFVSEFGTYPSKVTFQRVLKKEQIIEFFKEKNLDDELKHFTETSSSVVNKDPDLYTSNFFFTLTEKKIAVNVKINGFNDFFGSDPLMDEPKEEEGQKHFDGFDYEVDIFYDPADLKKSTIEKCYVEPLRKLGTEKQQKKKLSIVSRDSDGFYLNSFEVKEPKIDFDLNYNKDFKPVDERIKDRLNREADKGIVLLHGEPGTGKTMYIRHLINNLEKEHIIYLPPKLVDAISDPSFATFLLNYPNSLLIIEDAEMAIKERKGGRTHSVSNLLNMADGLLADALKMQILATFNSEIHSIDDALLRRGRLIAKYEFKPLDVKRAQALSEELGYEREISSPETLASIYNPEEEDEKAKQKQENSRKPVGF